MNCQHFFGPLFAMARFLINNTLKIVQWRDVSVCIVFEIIRYVKFVCVADCTASKPPEAYF